MKKSPLYFIFLVKFLLGVFILSFHVMGQSPSTQGVEFFAGFMKNGYRSCNFGTGGGESLALIASSKRACSVTVSNPRTGWKITRAIPVNGLVNIEIPETQAYSEFSNIAENKGLLITATDTISLFMVNEATNSIDASFILPTSSLLDEYMVQNFVPMELSFVGSCYNNNRSVFIIVATEDNTTVDITVKAATSGGQAANATFSVTLDRGQTYQVISNTGGTTGDFSGSHIKAIDCKKIAVFNGNVLTSIPNTWDNGLDHIFEQAMPVAYWGKEFVITSSAFRTKGDYVKVTALDHNTQVKRNGILLTTLNARESHTFNIPSDPGSCFLETTGPVAVNLYQTTSYHDNSNYGDPSMLWISPIEQQIKEIVFGTLFTIQNISVNYVNIVTKTSDIREIMLDGNGISSYFSPVSGNSNYSFARVPVSQGTHVLKSSSGFVAHSYGFGSAQGYAYSVGSSTINLNREIYLNGISSYKVEKDYFTCQSDYVKLDYSSNAKYDSIIWNMGDGTIFFQDSSIVYQYANSGVYTIMNIVKREFTTCAGSLYDTVVMDIRVKPNIIIEFRDSICPGAYSIWDFEFMVTQDTVIIDSATTLDNCAIAILYLKVFPTYQHTDTIGLCEHDFPVFYGGKEFNTIGNYVVPLNSVNGCDSIILLNIMYQGTIDRYFNDTICHGESYRNHGFKIDSYQMPTPGVHHFYRFSPTIHGCDSNLYLNLTTYDLSLVLENLTEDFCEDNKAVLVANTNYKDIRKLKWNTGATDELIEVNRHGHYYVIASIANCHTRDQIDIEKCDEYFYVPNAFTPSNADGLNDLFFISHKEGISVEYFEIYIYNRYGMRIFYSNDIDFVWNGTYKGVLHGNTIYTYVIHYQLEKEKKSRKTGRIAVF